MKKREALFGVVVLNRGSVYVGDVAVENCWCVITNTKRIESWGEVNALWQLAMMGPQNGTSFEATGTVRVLVQAIASIFDTDAEKWRIKV